MRTLAVLVALVGMYVRVGDAQERTRLLNDLNWIELRGVVPETVATVLLPAGTLEPHGVINNGADNTVPVELANRLRRVSMPSWHRWYRTGSRRPSMSTRGPWRSLRPRSRSMCMRP